MEKDYNKKYEQILQLAVNEPNDRAGREWMMKPWATETFAGATNAHIMILIDRHLIKQEYPKPEADIIAVIPTSRNIVLDVDNLKVIKALAEVPLDFRKEECDECEGEGEVEWTYGGNNGLFEKYFDCPECSGEGTTMSSKKIMDPDYVFKIGMALFSCMYVKILSDIASRLNTDSIMLISQDSENKGSLFQIGPVQILVMPMMQRPEDEDQLTIIFNHS